MNNLIKSDVVFRPGILFNMDRRATLSVPITTASKITCSTGLSFIYNHGRKKISIHYKTMSKFATTIKGLAKNRIVIFIAGMIVAILIGMTLQKTTESYESPEQLEAELNALLQEISKAPELKSMESAEPNPDIEDLSDKQGADLQALPDGPKPKSVDDMPIPEESDDEGEMMGGSMAPAPISP
jgi:hypothetical protein